MRYLPKYNAESSADPGHSLHRLNVRPVPSLFVEQDLHALPHLHRIARFHSQPGTPQSVPELR